MSGCTHDTRFHLMGTANGCCACEVETQQAEIERLRSELETERGHRAADNAESRQEIQRLRAEREATCLCPECQHVYIATDAQCPWCEIERLRAAGDSLVQEVKNLSVAIFGIEGTWRDSKAPWWQALVAKVEDWEAARAAGGGE